MSLIEEIVTDMTPATTQNLNSKLSAAGPTAPGPGEGVGISWSASAIHSSSPPVRIVGASRRYHGGYRVNV
jgi:hypothetical protein